VKHRIVTFLMAVAVLGAAAGASAQPGGGDRNSSQGAVYTMSNAADGNAVLVFDRLADGRLVPAASVPTGGNGTGTGLGSQGALTLTRNERWLLAVNPGSNTLSLFEVQARGLRLTDVVATDGEQPISVTEHHGVVYVVNAGSDSIAGFRLGSDGRLQPISGSVQPLGGSGVAPAQISFTPDGSFLLVTERRRTRSSPSPSIVMACPPACARRRRMARRHSGSPSAGATRSS
jgi:6-phosphogluconolactonase (cycloisomerase 2 family)